MAIVVAVRVEEALARRVDCEARRRSWRRRAFASRSDVLRDALVAGLAALDGARAMTFAELLESRLRDAPVAHA